MTRLMDLKIDFAFKQLFGKAGNETILLAFLNAALQLPEEERIRSVEILNPEIEREHIEDKASVLDIHAKTEQGEHVNIEIQLANKFDMEKRTLYYWLFMYSMPMFLYRRIAITTRLTLLLDFGRRSSIMPK